MYQQQELYPQTNHEEIEPDAFSEALMEHISLEKPNGEAHSGASPAEGAVPTITSPNKNSSGTKLLQQLHRTWMETPLAIGIAEEERKKEWLENHSFVQYLGSLIILDILVLNDRALILEELPKGS